MSYTFYIVYQFLQWLSHLTGLSYKEVNIIVFYILIPFALFALVDKILRKPICSISFLIVVIVAFFSIRDFEAFSIDLFDYSVEFLLLFSAIGIGYDAASVIVCIVLPFLLFIVLCYFAFPLPFRRRLPTFARAIDFLTRITGRTRRCS
jgi:hypothetical protein